MRIKAQIEWNTLWTIIEVRLHTNKCSSSAEDMDFSKNEFSEDKPFKQR